MVRKRFAFVAALVALLALLWATGGVVAGPPAEGPGGEVTIAGTVASKISYQGRLTDSAGNPLDGTYTMQFQLYDAQSGGTMLWDSGAQSVQVTDGLFNVELGVDQSDFNGQELWLAVFVDGEALLPRQQILPVPYALSLRPGARISGASTNAHLLRIDDSDTQTTYDALVVNGETTLQAIGAGRVPLIVINAPGEALRTLGDLNVLQGDLDVEGDVSYDGALIGAFPRPAYDSGWVSINQGETKTFTHNLGGNPDNYVVDMTCKSDSASYGVNQLFFGGMYAYDPIKHYGAYWKALTSTSIQVHRYDNDLHCDKVRVRIWVYK